MSKRAIPQVPSDPKRAGFDAAVKEIIEQITGQRGTGNKLEKLPDTSTLQDVIKKVNQIIDVMQ